MRDIEPLFSSISAAAEAAVEVVVVVVPATLVTGENLLANLRAFGDKRSRKVRGIIGALFVLGGNSVQRASDVILWITRTPSLTIVRRCNLSSSWSAAEKQMNTYILLGGVVSLKVDTRKKEKKNKLTHMNANIITGANRSSIVPFCRYQLNTWWRQCAHVQREGICIFAQSIDKRLLHINKNENALLRIENVLLYPRIQKYIQSNTHTHTAYTFIYI